MSEKKEYSPIEVAQEIAKRISNQLKKYEDTMAKSKNSAHEIDAGEEPNNDEAECPESLAAGSQSSEGSQEAPQGDSQESSEEGEEKKKVKKEGEEDNSSEDESQEDESQDSQEFEFRKSESGMHTVQYKTMAKGDLCKAKIDEGMRATDKKKARADRNEGYKPHQKEKVTADGARQFKVKESQAQLKDRLKNKSKSPSEEDLEYPMAASEDGKNNPSFDREKKDVEWTKNQRNEIDRSKPGKIKSNRQDQAKHIEEAKKRREAFRQQGVLKSEENKVEETKGIDLDKPRKSDKDKENFKRPMEKNGEEEKCCCEEAADKEKKVGVEKLKKFLGKQKQVSPGMVQEPQE